MGKVFFKKAHEYAFVTSTHKYEYEFNSYVHKNKCPENYDHIREKLLTYTICIWYLMSRIVSSEYTGVFFNENRLFRINSHTSD